MENEIKDIPPTHLFHQEFKSSYINFLQERSPVSKSLQMNSKVIKNSPKNKNPFKNDDLRNTI